MTTDVEVRDNADRHRYEAHLDGTLAGYIDYQLATNLVVLTHTEVDASFEGRGVGSALARAALDDVHERCLKALVICPFITGWVRNHRVSTSTCSTAHRRARSPTDPAAVRSMVGARFGINRPIDDSGHPQLAAPASPARPGHRRERVSVAAAVSR